MEIELTKSNFPLKFHKIEDQLNSLIFLVVRMSVSLTCVITCDELGVTD